MSVRHGKHCKNNLRPIEKCFTSDGMKTLLKLWTRCIEKQGYCIEEEAVPNHCVIIMSKLGIERQPKHKLIAILTLCHRQDLSLH